MTSASRSGWPCGFGAGWHVDETYLKARGRWTDLYRAIDRDGNLIDAMLSEHRDMKAAKAFFRSARATMGFRPGQVTDGHSSYPVRSALCWAGPVHHRTSAYLNGFIRSRARGTVLHDMIEIVRADIMMSSAMLAPLAKRARREEAQTIWL